MSDNCIETKEVSVEDLKKFFKGEDIKNLEDYGITKVDNEYRISCIRVSENITIDEWNLEEANISFYSCIFEKTFNIKRIDSKGKLNIGGCSVKGNLIISSSTFHNEIRFSSCTLDGSLILEYSHFSGYVWLQNLHLSGLEIEESIFEQIFSTHKITCDFITYFDSKFNLDNRSTELTVKKGFKIRGGYIYETFIQGGDFESIYIEPTEMKKLKILSGEASNRSLEVKKIDISPSNIFETYIDNIFHLETLRIKGLGKAASTFSVNGISVNELIIEDMERKGQLILRDIEGVKLDDKESIFRIKGSVLGSSLFTDIKFNSFGHILIDSSNVSEITTYGNYFPILESKSIKTSAKVTENEKYESKTSLTLETDFSKASEIYSQLQLAMKSQGNRHMELAYYASHMEAYRIALKESKQQKYTRFVLCLNKHTSEYGRNWFKAAIFTLLVGLIFFWTYVWATGMYSFSFDQKELPYFFGKFWEFILPIHKVDFMFENPSGWAITVDMISRIFLGILIYQTIAAFRSHGKR